MKKLLTATLMTAALSGAASAATTLFTEGFEGSFPPVGWTENSIDQSDTYAFNGTYSAKFSAGGDTLITPAISNATTFIFWSYTTSADPQIVVEHASSPSGPWTEFTESPFSGDTEQWNGRWVTLANSQPVYIRLRKDGTGSLYVDDAAAEDDGAPPANTPPVLDPIGSKSVNEEQVLMFMVSADDADNDPLTYTASNLPPGAVFSTNTITPQFTWAHAGPAGVYTSRFYVTDGTTNDFEDVEITVTNAPAPPPLTGTVWNVFYNLPFQSGSASDYPGQFVIRDALVERIDALQSGDSAVLGTFTFSAEAGAGFIMNAMSAALDRGASVSFIADGDINIGTVYGGTNSLLDLSTRPANPLTLAVDGSTGGIMHNKIGLFDYGGNNQWVFTASWNFTLGASANQWNIALEARSPQLYSIYSAEAAELLAGRFHDDPAKSHTHDGSAFMLDGAWGTNFVRFSPPPGSRSVEDDIIAFIDGAQSNIVFALNKLNREPIRDALTAAANRGVQIQGVMPHSDTDPGGVSDDVYSALTNHVAFLPATAKADYSALDSGQQDLIHAKYMVIDSGTSNAVVIHGSANWTTEGLVDDNDNDENTLFLRHNKMAAQFYNHFERITGTGAYSEGNSTLVSWDFEDSDQVADGGIAANATQAVIRVPAPSSYSYTADALSCSGWQDGAETKYWETSFTTIDHTDIKVSSVQLASSTGPADFKLQYKIGAGGTYTDVPYSEVRVPDGGNGVLTRVLLPDECSNQSAVFLRWMMTSNTSARGDDVGSSGAGRIDDIIITGTAYDQPPVLDPIGSRSVFESESLSYPVTASDPVDGDPVTLSATNLPTGAAFTNNTFSWQSAAPVGSYNVTFIATDKDGSTSETVTITVIEKPLLIISEIADPAGTGGDAYRFVELYNAGPDSIDLAFGNWHLSKQVNGETWYDIELTNQMAASQTWVLAGSASDFAAAYNRVPDQESSTVSGNGDDAWFLFYGGDHTDGILIDIYGEFDTDGTDTAWDYEDSRAFRNDTVLEPNSVWTAEEWTIRSGTSTNSMTPGEHGPRPVFQELENPFVFLGDNLALEVTAVNTIKTDVITLYAVDLPDGALFPTNTATNAVSSLLSWRSPTAGVYSINLAAQGAAGTRTRQITVTVSATDAIAGSFSGWAPDTIVKLENGQFWRNTGGAGSTISPALNDPDITVTNVFGTRRMLVESVPSYTTVERIDITASHVESTFSGLHNGNTYQLADGTVCKQVSFENISSSADPVTAWRWVESGTTYIRFVDRNNIEIGTCKVIASAAPAGPNATQIEGWFRGWKQNRIFALANGEFWQQVTADSSVDTLYRPTATLTNHLGTGIWRLTIDGAAAPAYVEVRQLTNVVQTAIAGTFYGFGSGEFFKLQNGEWWRQTSGEPSASIRSNPAVLLWNSTIQMPDEGRSVTAERLNVIAESSIIDTFRGLRYAQIYKLANGQEWAQISFEHAASEEQSPTAMVWTDGDDIRLLARDSRDRTIGTCTVISPWNDDDGDGIPNIEEMIAGTSRLNRNEFFYILSFDTDSTGRAVLRWIPVSGRTYTVEWTPSLLQPFQTLETLTDWTQDRWTDTVNPPGSGGFYRIRAELKP